MVVSHPSSQISGSPCLIIELIKVCVCTSRNRVSINRVADGYFIPETEARVPVIPIALHNLYESPVFPPLGRGIQRGFQGVEGQSFDAYSITSYVG